METEVRPGLHPDQLVIQVKGELDLYNSPQFSRLVSEKVGRGARRLVLSLGGLTYLDSSGTGALIRALQMVAPFGGALLVVGLTGSPRKVLEMCNIISLLRIFPDEAAALAWEPVK